MDMHNAYTWIIMTSAKPQQRRYPYEGYLNLGQALSKAGKSFVAIWDAMGQAITKPLRSLTYCEADPQACPG